MGKKAKGGYVLVDTDHMGQNSYTHFKTKEKGEAGAIKLVNKYILSYHCSDDDKREPFTNADDAIDWYNDLEANLDEGYHIELELCS